MKKILVIFFGLLIIGTLFYLYLQKNTPRLVDTSPSITKTYLPEVLKESLQEMKPVNRNADDKTKKVLHYFYNLSNDKDFKMILGQQIGHANEGVGSLSNNYDQYFTALEKETGKLPALMGMDYGWEKLPDDYTGVNKLLIDHSKKGGIVEISMSPGNPFTGGGLRDFSLGGHAYKELFTQGTEANKRLLSDFDKVAKGLQELQDKQVTVLWRPFHEMNGDFFWWSYGEKGRASQEEYVMLWKYMFNYFTHEKKLNNLLWVYGPNASLWENGVKDTDYYYPGSDFVDIVGMDYYNDDLSQVNNHGNYDKLVALGKPFGFSEIGPQSKSGFDNAILLEGIRSHFPRTIYSMYWTGWTNLGVLKTNRAIVENSKAKEMMSDSSIITLDTVTIK